MKSRKLLIPIVKYQNVSACGHGKDLPVPHSITVLGLLIYENNSSQWINNPKEYLGQLSTSGEEFLIVDSFVYSDVCHYYKIPCGNFIDLFTLEFCKNNGIDYRSTEILSSRISQIRSVGLFEKIRAESLASQAFLEFEKLWSYRIAAIIQSDRVLAKISNTMIPIDIEEFKSNAYAFEAAQAANDVILLEKYGISNGFDNDSFKEILGKDDITTEQYQELKCFQELYTNYAVLYRHYELITQDGYIKTRYRRSQKSSRCSNTAPAFTGINSKERSVCKAPKGYKIIGSDLKNLEIRVAECIYKSKSLLALTLQEDIYAFEIFTADEIESIETLRKKGVRKVTKGSFIAFLYGQKSKNCAIKFGLPRNTADRIHTYYQNKFRDFEQGIKEKIKLMKSSGAAETRSGLKRRFQTNFLVGKNLPFYDNKVRNFHIQAEAAETFFSAVCRIDSLLEGLDAKIIMVQHDSITLLAEESIAEEIEELVNKILVEEYERSFPEVCFYSSSYICDNWK